MAAFNTAQYLADAIESIREQAFTDFELVVVNDGSTDGSSAILRSYADEEPRMRLIERPNQGLIETRNELLKEANGEFVAWMDSDDLSHPARLAHQVNAFDNDAELVCVGTDVRLIDPRGRGLGFERYPERDDEIRADQALGSGLRFPSTMQRRSIAVAVGGFRHPFRIGEDLDFLLRIAERGRLANLRIPLYVYRQHLLSTCTSLGNKWPEYRAAILALAEERRIWGCDRLQRGEQVIVPGADTCEMHNFRPIVLLDWADRAAAEGDRTRAFRYALEAIALAPGKQAVWKSLAKLVLKR